MLKIILLIGALVSLALYFIPTFIACRRDHAKLPAVVAVNILLGWTFLGWIVALVWSLIGTSRRPQPHR